MAPTVPLVLSYRNRPTGQLHQSGLHESSPRCPLTADCGRASQWDAYCSDEVALYMDLLNVAADDVMVSAPHLSGAEDWEFEREAPSF